MNKDVIYIDVEDDITSIIGKIKSSKEKIVALVPPKRVGVLQSAVNLKLLARTAEHSHKHLVIVTNDKPLIALSAVAMIPIARNLQSKPELAEVEEIGDDEAENIIDGSELPVGELVKTVDHTQSDSVEDVIETIDIDGDMPKMSKDITNIKGSKVKVPDFSRFRKKLFFGSVGVIAIIAFLVWAIGFAPAAKISITTKTSSAPVSMTLKLSSTDSTDVNKNIVRTVSKQIKRDLSVEFEATGQKDLGEKAKGTITIDNCDSSDSVTISSGTVFVASSGQRFISDAAVTVPGFTGSASSCRNTGAGAGTASVNVTAEQAGIGSNIGAKSYVIVGVSGDIYANGGEMIGGTTKMTTVVSDEDVLKAKQALADLPNTAVKQQLIAQFTNNESVVTDSFAIEYADAVSVPLVGQEVKGKAKLTSTATFSMTAIAKSELEAFLREAINKQISDESTQRVYDNGIDEVALSGFLKNDQGSTINVSAIGQIGPNINEDAIKEQSKDKQYGDIQALVSGIKGVSDVEIKFSYFWVNTAPNDTSKIDVEINLQK